VTEIDLDARRWRSRDDVFEALLKALRAPDWHGHNLDALNDSLRGGDLNAMKVPVAVRVTGLEEATPVARVAAWRIGRLFAELSNDGVGVAWSPAVEGAVVDGVSALEMFRTAALEKERGVEAGDTSQDAALHATMAANLKKLFALGPVGGDCIEALLRDDRPQIAVWIAADLASRGDQRGVEVLQAIGDSPGQRSFEARIALNELRQGRLRSPFGLTSR
jgi:RNAse (barnase) inhibitor barstar